MKYILYNLDTEKSRMFIEDLEKSVVDMDQYLHKMDALRYVANLTKGLNESYFRYFKNRSFPSYETDYNDKAYYLGYCVNKLLCVNHG